MLRNLSLLALGLVLAGVLFLSPATVNAGAGDVTCTSGSLSADVPHNLLVPSGSCNLGGHNVGNDVIVGSGAQLTSFGTSTIGHNVVAIGAALINIQGATTVNNDVVITGTSGGFNEICNTHVRHNLVVQNSGASAGWDIGTGGCSPGNNVGNDLIIRGNTGTNSGVGVHVADNAVGHNLTVTNNTGLNTSVDNNAAGGDAKCSGNTGQSVTGNTAVHVNTCK